MSPSERIPVELFPPGCICSSYGHGLTMTRVTAPSCPVHRPLLGSLYRETDADAHAEDVWHVRYDGETSA